MRLIEFVSWTIATLAAISSCEAVANFRMDGALTAPAGGFDLPMGYVCQYNISGTPPFNFEVRHRYGPYDVNSPEWKNTRVFWENSTVAVNTTNTTIIWVVPQRDYGTNWSFVPYVQDSSDNRTWARSFEQSVRITSSATSLKHGSYAIGILYAVIISSVWVNA